MKHQLLVILRLFAISSVLLLVSCSSTAPLQGQWILTAGASYYSVQISHIDTDELMLTSDLAEISGRYSVQDKKMTMVKASQPRISGIEFELNTENNWVITKSPPAVRLTTPIFGATLAKKQ